MIRELVEVRSDPDRHERGEMSGQWHVAPAAKSLTDFPTRRIVILSQVERHGWADRRAQHPLQHLSRVWFQQQLLRRDNSKKLQCITFLILFLQRCSFLVCNKVVRWKWNLKDFVTDFLYRRKRRIRLKYKHFSQVKWVATSRLCIRCPHCVEFSNTYFHRHKWTNVNTWKTQRNAENACVHGLCKRAFNNKFWIL